MSPLQLVNPHLLSAAVKVSVNPSSRELPGSEVAQKLIDGAAAFALLACVGAVIWGAAQWGFASRSNNYSQADEGKTRMLKGLGGAFAIGAAAALINFFFNAGTTVHA
ncbi:MAG: DUF6112 family protein [Solirubrobacterales bacterium]